MTENVDGSEKRLAYLQMVQSAIDRMSTMSAIFKGFTATVITGVAAVSFTNISKWVVLLSMVPILCFFVIDMYYLSLERRFRYLFNQIRNNYNDVDYDMDPPKIKKEDKKDAGDRCIDYLRSPSIYLFYYIVIVVAILIIALKFKGVI